VCVTLPCMLRRLGRAARPPLATGWSWDIHGGTTEDGLFTLQEAQCLGAATAPPAIQVNAEDMLGPTRPRRPTACSSACARPPLPTGYVGRGVPALNLTLRHREAGGPLRELADYVRAGATGPEAGAGQPGVGRVLLPAPPLRPPRAAAARLPDGAQGELPPKDAQLRKYLVCNADESEPGNLQRTARSWRWTRSSCWRHDARGLRDRRRAGYIYIRGEYNHHAEVLASAIAEARRAATSAPRSSGFPVRLRRHPLPGRGRLHLREETALLESLGGQTRQPRPQAAVPRGRRALRLPDAHQQRRDLASVPTIIERGADWYAALGTERAPARRCSRSPGTSATGHYEVVLRDQPARAGLRDGRRLRPGRRFKACWPARLERAVLAEQHLDTPARLRVAHAAGTSWAPAAAS